MTLIPRTVLGLALLCSLLVGSSSASHAAPNCSGRVLCAHTLGIALTGPLGGNGSLAQRWRHTRSIWCSPEAA